MFFEQLKDFRIILASQSPRRKYLLEGLGIPFEIMLPGDVDETFPEELENEKIALFLAEKKANAFPSDVIDDKTIVITADTIVWVNNHLLGKPENYDDAVGILSELSGNMHEVVTAVSLRSKQNRQSFYARSKVYFKKLSEKEIEYYIANYSPFDKAGAYGVQEWIGYIAIEKIEGSFYNVMGLPTLRLYEELEKFIKAL